MKQAASRGGTAVAPRRGTVMLRPCPGAEGHLRRSSPVPLRHAFARDRMSFCGWPRSPSVSSFVAALVLTVFGVGINEDKTPSLLERFWQSLLRILDPGTFSGDTGWPLRITMLLRDAARRADRRLADRPHRRRRSTARSSELRQWPQRRRRGGHTLVLGWSPRVFTLISEIVEANANQRAALHRGASPAGEAGDGGRDAGAGRRHPQDHASCAARGDPSSPTTSRIVNADEARSIVVLGGGKDGTATPRR